MVGVDKNKLPKKKTTEEEVKKTEPKIVKRTGTSVKKSTVDADAKIKAFKDKKAAEKGVKEEEVMHKKTHQDLINAVYKVADELKVEGGPWPMLRAAEWGHFTEDRGKLYDGPMIDDIDGFTDEQKKALKKVLGL